MHPLYAQQRGRGFYAITAVLILALIAAGCGSTSSGGSGGSGKKANVVFLSSAATSYGVALNKGAQTTAAEGASLTLQAANFDPQRQLAQCQSALAQGNAQGLMIYAVDNAAIIPCVRQAAAKKVKVVSVEGQIGPKLCASGGHQVPGLTGEVYYCPTDLANYLTELTVKACQGKTPCKAAVFTGPASYALPAQLYDALKENLKAHPDIQIVAHFTPGYDSAGAAAADTQTALVKYSNLDVIVEDDDASAAGVARALKQLGKTKSVDLIGVGGTTDAVARIKAGSQFGSVINTPQTDAKAAMQMLINSIRGHNPSQSELDTYSISPLGKDAGTLTKDNVNTYKPQW